MSNRTKLSQTGQGLIDDDREDEITPGSEIANIWGKLMQSYWILIVRYHRIPDKIKAVFPWYKRMHALMGTNPTVSKASVAHSNTSLDISILTGIEVCDGSFFAIGP